MDVTVDRLTQARLDTSALIRAAEGYDRAKVEELTEGPRGIDPPPTLSEPAPETNLREVQLLARAAVGLPWSFEQRARIQEWGDHKLRVGHIVRATGEVVPVIAEALAAGVAEPVDYPDRAVADALRSGDARHAAGLLLRSPVRWLAREPEAVTRLNHSGDLDPNDPRASSWSRLEGAFPEVAFDPFRVGIVEGEDAAPTPAIGPVQLSWKLLASYLNQVERSVSLRHWIELESLALQHAARIAERSASRAPVAQVWQLGRLIQQVILESPFFGADAELLSARLSAVASTESAKPPSPTWDPLWPGRLAELDLGEICGISALGKLQDPHEALPSEVRLALEKLASRLLSEAEFDAERALHERNGLGWVPRHVAPPLAARWLLHIRGGAWFGRLAPSIQSETIDILSEIWPRDSTRVRWILHGLDRELRDDRPLDESLRGRVAALIGNQLPEANGEDIPALALIGSFLHGQNLAAFSAALQPADVWLRKADEAGIRWKVGLLRTFAERSTQLRNHAISGLVNLAKSDSLGLPASTALIGLVRAGCLSVGDLPKIWDTLPAPLRRDPELLRDYNRVTRGA